MTLLPLDEIKGKQNVNNYSEQTEGSSKSIFERISLKLPVTFFNCYFAKRITVCTHFQQV